MFSTHLQSIETPIPGVQIWRAQLDSLSPTEMAELNACLDSGERERAARFHFEEDRKRYVASRGLLRYLIGNCLSVPTGKLVFGYGAQGKPILIAPSSQNGILHFNLSHSSAWAMFALAWDRDLGIDLESAVRLKGDVDELVGLATRILSGRELEIWKALPDVGAREAAFLRAWTRKEAYAKATGKGLFNNLNSVEVSLDAADAKSSLLLSASGEEDNNGRDWILYDLLAPEGFAAALAVAQ